MFTLKVDDTIDLVFLHESLAAEFVSLAEKNREYLSTWLAWPKMMRTEDDFRVFIKKSLHDYADGNALLCGIRHQKKLIGRSGFTTIHRTLKKAELSYWIAEEFQGKGIVARVCKTLIAYAFETLEMKKIEISVATENLRSRTVCERLGFELEGIITRAETLHGHSIDHAKYALHKRTIEHGTVTDL